MVLVQTQILKILHTGKGNILIVTKQLENFNTVRSYVYRTSTSRANFFFLRNENPTYTNRSWQHGKSAQRA